MIIRVTSRSANPLSTDLGTILAGQTKEVTVTPDEGYLMARNLTPLSNAGLIVVETATEPELLDTLEITGGESEVPLANVSGQHIVTAGDMSADIESPVIDVRRHDSGVLQLIWTGTPTGTFVIESSASYDPDAPLVSPGTWDPLPLTATPTASGSADHAFLDFLAINFPFMRVKYTFASGTGSLDIWFAGKND